MKRPMDILITLISTLSLIFTPVTMACTGITLYSEDGAAIPGRTMEFSFDIQSEISIVPAGTEIETLITNAMERNESIYDQVKDICNWQLLHQGLKVFVS